MFGLLSGVRQYLGGPCELLGAVSIGMEMLSFMFLIARGKNLSYLYKSFMTC